MEEVINEEESFEFYKPEEDNGKEYKYVNDYCFLVNKPTNIDNLDDLQINELLKEYKLSIYFKLVEKTEDIFEMINNQGISLIDGCLLDANNQRSMICDKCDECIEKEYKYDLKRHFDLCTNCTMSDSEFEFGDHIKLVDTVLWDVEDQFYTLYRKKNANKYDIGGICIGKKTEEIEEKESEEEPEEPERTDNFFEELNDFTTYENLQYMQDEEEMQIRYRNRFYQINNTEFGSIYDWKPIITEYVKQNRIVWININKDSKMYKKLAISFNMQGTQFFTLQKNQDLIWLFKFLKNKKQTFSHFNICSLTTFKDFYNLELVKSDGCSIM